MTPRPTRDLLDTDERKAIDEAVERKAAESGLHPETRVSMSAKTWVKVIAGIAALVLSGASGYWALARADDGLSSRVAQTEKRIETFATKADLNQLRTHMQMDMLLLVWECDVTGVKGKMRCSPQPPPRYREGGW